MKTKLIYKLLAAVVVPLCLVVLPGCEEDDFVELNRASLEYTGDVDPNFLSVHGDNKAIKLEFTDYMWYHKCSQENGGTGDWDRQWYEKWQGLSPILVYDFFVFDDKAWRVIEPSAMHNTSILWKIYCEEKKYKKTIYYAIPFEFNPEERTIMYDGLSAVVEKAENSALTISWISDFLVGNEVGQSFDLRFYTKRIVELPKSKDAEYFNSLLEAQLEIVVRLRKEYGDVVDMNKLTAPNIYYDYPINLAEEEENLRKQLSGAE